MTSKGGEGIHDYNPAMLNTLLAEISGRTYHRRGELYVPEDTEVELSLPSSGAFVVSTGWTAGIVTGAPHVTIDAANGTITIGDRGRGVYQINNSTSFFSNKVTNIQGAVFLNGVVQEKTQFRRDITKSNNIGDAGKSAFSDGVLEPGDVLDFRFQADVNNVNLTLDHGNFNILWIGGE